VKGKEVSLHYCKDGEGGGKDLVLATFGKEVTPQSKHVLYQKTNSVTAVFLGDGNAM